MLNAFTLTAAHVLARFAHLLVYLGIGNFFGANTETDGVLLLQAPLLVIMAVTAGAADMVVMPVMHRAAKEGRAAGLPPLLLIWTLKRIVPIALATLAISFLWLNDASWQAALILLPMPVLSTSSAIFQGIMNAQGHFHRAAFGPLFGAILAAPFLLLPPSAESLALILLCVEAGRFLVLGASVRNQFRCPAARPEHQELLAWAIQGARWQAMGTFCAAINLLVHTLAAAQLGAGVVTQIEYAGRLWNMVPLLFSGPITLLHASFSRTAASDALSVSRVHRVALVMLVAAAIVGCSFQVAAPWIAQLLYGAGKMDPATLDTLGQLLSIYFLAAIPVIPAMVYVKALSAQGKARVTSTIAVISVPVNLILVTFLATTIGEIGIPSAFLATMVVNALSLAYWMQMNDKRHSGN